MFDGRANDVAFGDGDDVGDSITRIDHSTGEGALFHLLGGPRSSEGEHGLDGNIQARNVESFEHDFSSVFTVFGLIEWRFG